MASETDKANHRDMQALLNLVQAAWKTPQEWISWGVFYLNQIINITLFTRIEFFETCVNWVAVIFGWGRWWSGRFRWWRYIIFYHRFNLSRFGRLSLTRTCLQGWYGGYLASILDKWFERACLRFSGFQAALCPVVFSLYALFAFLGASRAF